MTFFVSRAASHRIMPWKNGGGSTTEIAVYPEGADLSSFDWRISMARVERDGPFSLFPEIDRTLCLLEGDGMVLHGGGVGPLTVTPESEPAVFPGDVPVHGRLRGRAVTDLNVMTRRGRFRHSVDRLGRGSHRVSAGDGAVFLFVTDQTMLGDDDGCSVDLGALDMARIDGHGPARVEARGDCYVITLRPDR